MTPTSSPSRRVAAVAMIVLAGWIAAACGGSDSGSDGASEASPPAEAGTGAGDTDATGDGEGDDGRAFDSTDDAVVEALTTATEADDVSWDGSTVVLTFDEGSVEDPTAWTTCSAAEVLIAEDESVRIVYPDGELDCTDRPGT